MSMCGICWFDGRALTDERDDLRKRVIEAEAQRDGANKKGHEAVLLAMKHEDSAKRAQAEVSRLADLLNKADPNWGSPMRVLEEMHDQIVARNQRIKQLEDELEWDDTEKSNYCQILTALGMEEEGDPVQGVLELVVTVQRLTDENDELDRRIGRIVKEGL